MAGRPSSIELRYREIPWNQAFLAILGSELCHVSWSAPGPFAGRVDHKKSVWPFGFSCRERKITNFGSTFRSVPPKSRGLFIDNSKYRNYKFWELTHKSITTTRATTFGFGALVTRMQTLIWEIMLRKSSGEKSRPRKSPKNKRLLLIVTINFLCLFISLATISTFCPGGFGGVWFVLFRYVTPFGSEAVLRHGVDLKSLDHYFNHLLTNSLI